MRSCSCQKALQSASNCHATNSSTCLLVSVVHVCLFVWSTISVWWVLKKLFFSIFCPVARSSICWRFEAWQILIRWSDAATVTILNWIGSSKMLSGAKPCEMLDRPITRGNNPRPTGDEVGDFKSPFAGDWNSKMQKRRSDCGKRLCGFANNTMKRPARLSSYPLVSLQLA